MLSSVAVLIVYAHVENSSIGTQEDPKGVGLVLGALLWTPSHFSFAGVDSSAKKKYQESQDFA